MKLLRNNVLIKPDKTDFIQLAGGQRLFLDTRFEEYKSAPQTGIVTAVPEKLAFSNDPNEYSLDIQTDMEIQVGDRVIFNYNARAAAINSGLTINDDILVRYDMIYVAIRNEQVICVNGVVIVEPEDIAIKTSLVIPEYLKGRKQKMIGKVIYASAQPHGAERFSDLNTTATPMYMADEGFSAMDRYVQPGDRVLFHFSNAIPLQHYHEFHGALSKTILYRMRHTDIDCVLADNFELECTT